MIVTSIRRIVTVVGTFREIGLLDSFVSTVRVRTRWRAFSKLEQAAPPLKFRPSCCARRCLHNCGFDFEDTLIVNFSTTGPFLHSLLTRLSSSQRKLLLLALTTMLNVPMRNGTGASQSSNTKAVILVGGPSRGTRFRPLSLDTPKVQQSYRKVSRTNVHDSLYSMLRVTQSSGIA